jgi:hypothetical protein
MTSSPRLLPARLNREDAKRIARQMRRDLGRPIVVAVED